MKLIKNLFSVFLICSIYACSNDNEGDISTLNHKKQITAFRFLAVDNATLPVDVVGVIDENTKSITVTVPKGTDITALLPEIEVSAGAVVTLQGVYNFTHPVRYKVTAEDESTVDYIVTVKLLDERDILIAIHEANPGNILEWDTTTMNISSWAGVTTDSNGNVTGLELRDKNLTSIPAEIGQLTDLTLLSLRNNNISELPAEVGYLTNLNFLNLYNNNLSSLPTEIGQLIALNYLDLWGNKLSSIPVETGQLVNLTFLNLGSNKLVSLPAEIGQLTHLTFLSAQNNIITSLPSEISQLVNLTFLKLSGNNLAFIPVEMGQLTALTHLTLSSNTLTSLPSEIGLLTNLTLLDLQENDLTTIPQAVCNLEADHGTTINKDTGVTCTP